MDRRWRLRGTTLGLFCTAAQLCTPAVRAEDASATETAAARALAVDGLKLAQAGNCVDAVSKLERAEKLYHSAVVASRLGECYVSVGRLVEGTEILRKTLREPPPSEPSPALVKALDRAQRALDAAKPRIAALTIKVATVSDMTVRMDGSVVPGALVDTEIPSDPGEHAIEVSAPGFLKAATRISVGEGEKKTVTMTLTRDPNALAAVAPEHEAAQTRPASQASTENVASASSVGEASSQEPNRIGAYVALGGGVAAVAAGGVLGALAMGKQRELEGVCPDGVCPPEHSGDLDSAKRLGTFSTVAFGVGGASILLGAVLFFTATPSSADHARLTQKPRRFAGLSNPRASVGLTSIELGADF